MHKSQSQGQRNFLHWHSNEQSYDTIAPLPMKGDRCWYLSRFWQRWIWFVADNSQVFNYQDGHILLMWNIILSILAVYDHAKVIWQRRGTGYCHNIGIVFSLTSCLALSESASNVRCHHGAISHINVCILSVVPPQNKLQWLIFCWTPRYHLWHRWPLLLTWFNFNPSMDK